ncbi:MAG: lipid carrier--UDP-N-acetylgalactosaminyltransferase [Pirellula sp.]|nr:lipid carrier--UDP-N-acetylgalactosaminyltransferase [Pirellula sp.]
MKRWFDLAVTLAVSFVAAVPCLILALAVKLTSRGPILYWSDRVGRDNQLFKMPKFRSMRIDTPEVASHLLVDSERWLTPIGRLLRSTSLDELPQLWCILNGSMSLVGPRPALFNQHDLIALRTARGVHRLTPGLTGWAQILGRDEFTIEQKTDADAWYAAHQSMILDLKILFATALHVVHPDGSQSAQTSRAASPLEAMPAPQNAADQARAA